MADSTPAQAPPGAPAGLTPEAIQFAHRMFDAARTGDDVLLQAIDAGLPVNLTNDEGNTLLMLATYAGHVALARGLLTRGADANRTNDRGQSPLAGAVFKAHDEIVRLLLEHGADPTLGTPTALATAEMFNRKELLEEMKAKVAGGAQVEVAQHA